MRRALIAIVLLLVPSFVGAQTLPEHPAPAIVTRLEAKDRLEHLSLLAPQQSAAPPRGQGWLVPTSAAGLALGSAALGIGTAFLLPSLQFRAQGRPNPIVTGAGVGLGFGVGVAVSQLLVPLAASWGGNGVSPDQARAQAWRLSRWAVLGGALGTGLLMTGSVMEHQRFGAGQGAMGVGASVVVLSALTYVVLEVVGVSIAHP